MPDTVLGWGFRARLVPASRVANLEHVANERVTLARRLHLESALLVAAVMKDMP